MNNLDLNEQLNNLTPEAFKNFNEARFKGSISFIKSNPLLKWIILGMLAFFILVTIAMAWNFINFQKRYSEFQSEFKDRQKQFRQQ